MQLINIGFGNMVSSARLFGHCEPRFCAHRTDDPGGQGPGMLINTRLQQPDRSVVIMDTDHVILSAVAPGDI